MGDPISDAVRAAIAREQARYFEQRAALPIRDSERPPDWGERALAGVRAEMADGLAAQLGAGSSDSRFAAPEWNLGRMLESLLTLRGVRWVHSLDLAQRAIMSGDLPAIMTSVGNRLLRQSYEAASSALLPFARRVDVQGFTDAKSIQLSGEGLGLAEVKEAGEIVAGKVVAGVETFAISTYARIYSLSARLWTADDLGAFRDFVRRLGESAAATVAAKLAAALESTAAMSDGVAPFHANHANLGSAGALSETTLAELVKLLRNQTGLASEKIENTPRALVVPPALEFTARKVLAVLGQPAPFAVAVEPRLSSATAHYLLGSAPGLAVAMPEGVDGPRIEVGRLPGREALAVKVVVDFGAGFEDWRGLAKNAGA